MAWGSGEELSRRKQDVLAQSARNRRRLRDEWEACSSWASNAADVGLGDITSATGQTHHHCEYLREGRL